MTCSRIAHITPGLALLGVLGVASAGIYLYQHLPELLRLQAERTLRQYGVEKIEYEGLRLSHARASVESLRLLGSYDNLAYQARVGSGAAQFDWRTLLRGKVHSLFLSSLEISVAPAAVRDDHDTTTAINVEELLPPRLLARLPFQSLRIDGLRASYRAPGSHLIEVDGSVVIDQHIDLRLHTTLARCALAGQLAADSGSPELLLKLSMGDAELPVATLAALLARSAGPGWEWQLQGQAQHGPLLACLRNVEQQYGLALGIPAQNELSLTGESVISARIEHPGTLNLAAAPDAADAPLRQLQASIQLASTVPSLAMPALADSMHGRLVLDATLANARINAVLQPFHLAGQLAAQRLPLPERWRRRLGWVETIPFQLEAAQPVTIASGAGGGWSVQSPDTVLTLGGKDSQLSARRMNLGVSSSGSAAPHASVELDALLSARLDGKVLPQLQLAVTQGGTRELSDFTLRIADTTESFRFELAGALNPAQGSGNYTLDAYVGDLPYLAATTTPLLQHFDVLDNPVAIRSGTITLTSTLASTGFELEKWTQQSQLSAKRISGTVSDYAFEDLELTTTWSGITEWKTLEPLQISVARFNAGIALQDITLQVSLPTFTPIAQPQVRIDAFSTQVFGGELALAEAQVWDFAAARNSVTLVASDWQLGEMVAVQENADIEAEGVLEGVLPLTIADGRAIIDSGYLRASPPGGHIRYRANADTRALAETNAELALALDLLSDFQYQLLSSEVQLDRTGNLLLALSLEGSNPALYAGQLVRFNINVEQNLDPLLQSLRIGDNLAERIEGGMQ